MPPYKHFGQLSDNKKISWYTFLTTEDAEDTERRISASAYVSYRNALAGCGTARYGRQSGTGGGQ